MDKNYSVLGLAKNASYGEIRAAYRTLARKWHPDRFQEGPERAWAEERMIEINCAYNALIHPLKQASCPPSESSFREVRLLIEAGQLSRARQIMCAMEERGAEWNYHFGLMLFERKDYEKARVYFGIACRQAPDNPAYSKSLEIADGILSKKRRIRPFLRFGKSFRKK